jgi:hypothetical protein
MSVVEDSRALQTAISHLLSVRIAEVTEEVVKKATDEFEAKLRRQIASTSMEVSNFYEMRTQGNNLVITVRKD